MTLWVWTALVGVLVLLSVGAGGAFTWALCPAAIVLAVVFGTVRWRQYRTGSAPDSHGRTLDVALGALVVFLAVNVVPMPLGISRITGSERYAQNVRVAEALRQGETLGLLSQREAGGFALTRNRAGSLRATVLAIAASCAGLLTATLTRRGKQTLMACLVLLGAGLAVAGIVSLRYLPQGDTIWWRFPIEHGLPGPVACFYNRNHFAGYLAMLCPVALALTLCKGSIRWWLRVPFGVIAFAAMSVAIVATHSRGALLAYGAALAATAVLLLVRRRLAAALVILSLLVLAAAIVTTAPLPLLRSRLSALRDPASEGSVQTRLTAWRDTLAICRTYPVMGAGPDAFRMVYPQHRTTSRSGFMTHTENEYVQSLAELGVVGMLLVLCAAATFLKAVRWAKREQDTVGLAAWTGAWAALFAAAVHAGVEFVLHTPLAAVTLAMLAGFLLPAPERTDGSPPGRWRVLWLPCVLVSLVIATTLSWRRMHRFDAVGFFDRANVRELEQTLEWAPTSWQAWYHYGRMACLLRHWDGVRFGERCITQATEYDPLNYKILRELGKLRLSLGDDEGARDAFARVKELRWWVPVPEVPE